MSHNNTILTERSNLEMSSVLAIKVVYVNSAVLAISTHVKDRQSDYNRYAVVVQV
jgi:hypothetical protein